MEVSHYERLDTSASGTSETNGFGRFESAIVVKSDIDLPAAQGRV